MIREIGIRPAGATMRHCLVNSETVVYLDGRELFRFSDLLQTCDNEIVIDWNHIEAVLEANSQAARAVRVALAELDRAAG